MARETFTNTFENGMSSDADKVFQPQGTYLRMERTMLLRIA